MDKMLVRDLMVPLEKYATVHADHLLVEAIHALEKAQAEFESHTYRHRAVLVYDDDGIVVGKLSQWDVIRCLEPKYDDMGDLRSASLSGLSPAFIRSMMEKHNLWQEDMDAICNRVARKKVKDVMSRPNEREKIATDGTIGEALHAFVIGRHQSLLVVEGKEIVGILRLTDVFKLLCEKIKTCRS